MLKDKSVAPIRFPYTKVHPGFQRESHPKDVSANEHDFKPAFNFVTEVFLLLVSMNQMLL